MRSAKSSFVAVAGAALLVFSLLVVPRIGAAQGSPAASTAKAVSAKSAAAAAAPDPVPATRPRGSKAPGDFDFYVLALSWSPGFCATGGAEKARTQCAQGANLGFVVHGLWPQYARGYPSDCSPSERYPSRIALQGTKGLYPDEGLARYEWRKHGTCSGKSPTDYFADVRRAREAIVIPQPFRDPHQAQSWTPVDVQRAFIAANPRLRPGMMAVECTRGRAVLREVRICFSKDLRNFVACPEVARHFCYGHAMTVPPVL